MRNLIYEVVEQLKEMNEPERAVILALATKMNTGSKKYSRWNPESDQRNFDDEISCELLDALNYIAMKKIKEGSK